MELEKFKITVLPLREKLLNVSMKWLDNRADAEDTVQEAFLKLWHIRDRLEAYQSIEALAVIMARNLALDKLRQQKPDADLLDNHLPDSEMKSPAELLEQQDAVNCIRRLIEQLPALQQTIIRMKDIEGYEVSEIAEITGTQAETIRVNLSRARKKIRERFTVLNQGIYEYR
jgi:RNA polymerase sigma-70 factor (ECF subfamily)